MHVFVFTRQREGAADRLCGGRRDVDVFEIMPSREKHFIFIFIFANRSGRWIALLLGGKRKRVSILAAEGEGVTDIMVDIVGIFILLLGDRTEQVKVIA